MKKQLDLASWNRREHFAFFSQLDEPFHGTNLNVDCTHAYRYCKQKDLSFFLFYLHSILRATNETDAMRYRVENEDVVDYSVIHANATVQRADHTFGFCPIYYNDNFHSFASGANEAMDKIKNSSGLCFNDECAREDVIHFSAIPWISFTGLTHARQYDRKDSVPKISVGKMFEQDGKLLLPFAIFVHHGLVDAYHVHQFLSRLETLFNNPEKQT
ncbi:CatA-like O-acetyltransferase [Undibacterium sp. Ji50W]|uniref:CatA-like O-acetyltransferase n=1 Tax=Undibacterium sp. Ji50W TaxID=3413041 RepID=UPI003BF37867